MSSEVQTNMEYIQKLFLGIQHYMQEKPGLDDLVAYLDAEPLEFRSVAYESASMEIGLHDLSTGTQFQEWKKFYNRSEKVHSFHLDIGLGWAFAKAGTIPEPNWESLHPLMRWMVFDGIGYYHGLFKGRRTIRKHIVLEGIEGQDRKGYDQGIGRRLWYIAKGEVKEVTSLIEPFPASRHPGLWRGVGIACGYVGGSEKANLELLLAASGQWKQQLCTGIALAAMSRSASDSITDNIETACQVLCGKSVAEIVKLKPKITDKPEFDIRQDDVQWITQFESAFV